MTAAITTSLRKPFPDQVSPGLRLLGALALFLALTLVMTFPMILHLTDGIPGFEGDNILFLWEIWWVKRALVDLQTSPFFSTSVYYPVGYELARDDLTPANTVLGLPFTLWLGPVLTYNAMSLLSFVLSGFGTYLWVTRMTGQRSAGLLSGIAFAFLPYRFAHLAGHLNFTTTQWMPLTLVAIDGCLKKPTLSRGMVLGVFFALVVLSAWYYAVFAALLIPLYLLLRWPGSRHAILDKRLWATWGVGGIAALLIIWPFVWPSLQLATGESFTRGLVDKETWALNPYDYLVPNRLSPWWNEAVTYWFPHQSKLWVELGVSISYVVVALSVIGLARREHEAMAALLAVLAVAYLVSLGPTLHWNDRQVRVTLPDGVDQSLAPLGVWNALGNLSASDQLIFRSGSSVAIPLPSAAIHYWLPLGGALRAMDRMAIWVALMLSGLAGLGVVVLRSWLMRLQLASRWPPTAAIGGWQVALWMAAALLILIESYSTVSFTPLKPRAVDVWLAQLPANTIILELPWYRRILDYYGTVHHKATVFGAQGATFAPALQKERVALAAEFPSAKTLAALKQWTVSYVLFTPSFYPNAEALQQQIKSSPELQLERVLEDVWVYRVLAQ